MPEEINRILVDQLSSMHFVTEESGLQHQIRGLNTGHNVHFVGNTMIDTLVAFGHKLSRAPFWLIWGWPLPTNLPADHALSGHRGQQGGVPLWWI